MRTSEITMLERLAHDLHAAGRQMARRPAFSATVALTLALAIATLTIAYGVATAILWRPLPFRDASQLHFVWERTDSDGQVQATRVTAARATAWRDASDGITALSLFAASGFSMETGDGLTPIRGLRVSANYFATLGVSPLLGRDFTAADEQPGQHRVVMLSHALWQRRFGGRQDVVGSSVRLSGEPYTIVGVMPAVTFPGWPVNPAAVTIEADAREYWVPIVRAPGSELNVRAHVFGVIARVKDGADAARVAAALSAAPPVGGDAHGAHLAPLRDQFVSDARQPLVLLLGAAAAVLLIACANLAALHVTAFERRRAEWTVRAAIGAGASRIARQLALESIVVALAGGAGGLLLARAALAIVPALLPPSVPFLTSPALDVRVAAFGVLIAVAAGLLLVAWPIARLMTAPPAPRGVAERPRSGAYRGLVIAQVAMTLALVTCAALLTQSLRAVRSQDPGFTLENIVTADVALPGDRYRDARAVVSAQDRMREAVLALPGVRAAAFAYDHPLEANWSGSYTLAGAAARSDDGSRAPGELRIVSPSYFDAVGVEVIEGRSFAPTDTWSSGGVALVNEAFVRAEGGVILGRTLTSTSPRLTWGPEAPSDFVIVGVVENERFRGLERPTGPAVYLSTTQFPQQSAALLVKTAADPRSVIGGLRTAIHTVEPSATSTAPRALEDILHEQLASRRVTTDVLDGFAGAALGLSALGLYGLLAIVVSSRTREIGLRIAIGATPGNVARRVVRDSVVNAAIGVAGGLALSLATGRLVQNLLVGVKPYDLVTLSAASAAILLVALAAALLPALRAARVDPARALMDS